MKLKLLFILPLLFSLILIEEASSQDLNGKWSEATAQSFIKRNPEPDSISMIWDKNHFSWQAGYVMFAMEKIWKSTGDSTYFNYIKRYVDQQLDEDGRVLTFKDTNLDHFLPGYAIIFMYEQTGDERYRIAATQVREGFKEYPRNSDGLFWHGTWATNQSWIDGVFMGQIFLARYGSVIGDSEYAFDEVVKQMTLMAAHCEKENGLILHGWDESKKASWANKTTGLSSEVWSEGLGWYAVLMADVFDYLPEDHPGYQKLVEIHRKLCKGLKDTQDPESGMWCQVVDRCGEEGNWNETSGTGMFIYLLKKSINKGWISADEYSPVVNKAYAGMIKKARYNDQGFIDVLDCSSIGIVDSYDAYINSPKEVSPFGAFGSFIIATNIMEISEFEQGLSYDIKLDMSNPDDWTVDVVHLGSKQVEISYDETDEAVIMMPTWSADDTNSADVATSNIENGRLHLIQHIDISDCTQSEVHFEINMPQAYIDEGKMEFVFSLQAGGAGDYMFNGHTFTMSDFEDSGESYKKMGVLPADYNEPLIKLRKIERINIIFERKGSLVSAPIKIRKLGIVLNEDKILPPPPEVKVTNPHSFYQFNYNKQEAIDALEVRVSNESMDITRQINQAGNGLALIPQWGEGQIPKGHSGDVIIVQSLGVPHDFEQGFEIEYVMNIPQAYFDENKIQIKPFVQAGELGYYVWSGVTRDLSFFSGKGGQDIIISLSSEDFLVNKQKRKNLIELIGFGIDRHGSTITEAITVKGITIKLPD